MTQANTWILRGMARWQCRERREEGASMAEYGLLLALVAVVAIVTLKTVGTNVKTKFQAVADNLK